MVAKMPMTDTEMQRNFAAAYVNNGGNAAAAARDAGYSEASARTLGSRMARNPAVQSMIRTAQFEMLGGELTSLALGRLKSILLDPNTSPSAVVAASVAVLERSGLHHSVEEKRVMRSGKHINQMSIEELHELVAENKARMTELKAKRAVLESPTD